MHQTNAEFCARLVRTTSETSHLDLITFVELSCGLHVKQAIEPSRPTNPVGGCYLNGPPHADRPRGRHGRSHRGPVFLASQTPWVTRCQNANWN